MLFEVQGCLLYYSLKRWPELTVLKVLPTHSHQNIPLVSRTLESSQCLRGILGSPVPPGLECQGGKSVCNIWCIPRTTRVPKKLVPSYHGNTRASDAQNLRELSMALVGLEETSSIKYRWGIWDSDKLLYFTPVLKHTFFVHPDISGIGECILKSACSSLNSSFVFFF